jgi:hypothetical protein
MENKLECRPVLLPTTLQTVNEREEHTLWTNTKGQILHTHTSQLHSLIPQHLYFVSNRDIGKDEWFWASDRNQIFQNKFQKTSIKEGFPFYYKIEASTDSSLGLPGIPQSFIQEYVAKQGKIDKVYISIYDYEGVAGIVEVDMENQVIILPTVEDENDIKKIITMTDLEEAADHFYSIDENNPISFELQNAFLAGVRWKELHPSKTYTREDVIDSYYKYEAYFDHCIHEVIAPLPFEEWFDLNHPTK